MSSLSRDAIIHENRLAKPRDVFQLLFRLSSVPRDADCNGTLTFFFLGFVKIIDSEREMRYLIPFRA